MDKGSCLNCVFLVDSYCENPKVGEGEKNEELGNTIECPFWEVLDTIDALRAERNKLLHEGGVHIARMQDDIDKLRAERDALKEELKRTPGTRLECLRLKVDNDALKEDNERLREAVGKCRKQEAALEIMKREGFVIDNLEDRWQKLVFTLYTDLCEIDSIVRAALEEGEE